MMGYAELNAALKGMVADSLNNIPQEAWNISAGAGLIITANSINVTIEYSGSGDGISLEWTDSLFDTQRGREKVHIIGTVIHAPARSSALGMNGDNVVNGIIALNIYRPANTLTHRLDEISDTIRKAFPKGTHVPFDDGYLFINQPSYVSQIQRDNGFFFSPLTIPYQAHMEASS